MITELPTYKLRNLSTCKCKTEIDTLFAVLYYKSWRLLAGDDGTFPVDFQVNHRFLLTDEGDTVQGGWKVIKQKYLILTLNNAISFCHVTYYDGVLLLLKVYGESQFVALVSSFAQLPDTKIKTCDIEAYIEGNKDRLRASYYDGTKVARGDSNPNKLDKKRNLKGKKPVVVDTLNKVLCWFVGLVTLICTYIFGFPFYGAVVFAGFLTLSCFILLKAVTSKKVVVSVFFCLLILFMIFLAYSAS